MQIDDMPENWTTKYETNEVPGRIQGDNQRDNLEEKSLCCDKQSWILTHGQVELK